MRATITTTPIMYFVAAHRAFLQSFRPLVLTHQSQSRRNVGRDQGVGSDQNDQIRWEPAFSYNNSDKIWCAKFGIR